MAAFQGFASRAELRLAVPDSAGTLGDLAGLPSDRLELLRGERAGQHGIRINAQWRICFHWTDEGPCDVGIVDHHRGRSDMNAGDGMKPVHPGEILRNELDEIWLSAKALSKALGVPGNRVTMILNGWRGVSADTALRLARYFGTTPQLWLNLQKTWELRQAEMVAGQEIARRVTPWPLAAPGALVDA